MRFISLTLALLTPLTFCHLATAELPCRSLIASVARTLGEEWEFADARFPAVNGEPKDWAERYILEHTRNQSDLQALATSKLRILFAFYGLNPQGDWIQNFIPDRVYRSERFEKIHEHPGIKLMKEPGGYRLINYDTLANQDFIDFLWSAMEGRGQHGQDLYLRKIPEAWQTLNSKWDQMIPNQVAEEWRDVQGGKFVGIEFPMQGKVDNAEELQEYIRNLWLRLGLFEESDPLLAKALKLTIAHIHWVPDILSAPIDIRKDLYEAVVGYWGDANDSLLISQINGLGSDKITNEYQLGALGASLTTNFTNVAIQPLMRDTYQKLLISEDGVRIDGLSSNATDLPVNFKFLRYGLRTLYSKPSLSKPDTFGVLGIEARNNPTADLNLESLPKKIKGKNEADVQALLVHQSQDARGLLPLADVKKMAKAQGIPEEMVDDFVRFNQRWDVRWSPSEIAGFAFLPLTPWLEHPLVKRSLAIMTSVQKENIIRRYQTSLKYYVSELNRLWKARQFPFIAYQPDLVIPLKEFPDHYNRVYPRSDFPEALVGQWTSNPDFWFKCVILGEMQRFLNTSGLIDLLKMDPPQK